ncbi:hypothetical protein Lfu02_25060 [Longispora fulva]|uniref:Basic secretory peptidase family protein n=1 Tax=Longispora fulva TaxID=619741 RepID=A0A8J7GWU0_9ACTN|nr:hypothetical protein [Longispora fulva]MBG6139483.1 hypothetical protein [Longispora fulva]GIG58134.1 hypothetical protein Lfu02_25060 [Longispora fulva]
MRRRTPLVVALVLALGGAGGAVLGALGAPAAGFLPATDPGARDAAFATLLDRRAKAVRDHDLDGYLADVDRARPHLVAAETRTFQNLARLPLTAFTYALGKARYELKGHPELADRYHGRVALPAVEIHYRISDVDQADAAAPYVPILAWTGGRWAVAGEATDTDVDAPVPPGAQPWQGDPIAVRATPRAVLVHSPEDTGRADAWAGRIESALDAVLRFRPGGWSGRVFVVAVRDRKMLEGYLGAEAGRVGAVAVAQFDRVPEWHPGEKAGYAGTVVVINPDGLDDPGLSATLVHEFTHAAMGPVTTAATPTWLMEGTAVYVEFGDDVLGATYAKKHLAGRDLSRLPPDDTFYNAVENYDLSLLACKLLVTRYGERGLVGVYEWFAQHDGPPDQGFREVLGISLADFTALWRRQVQDTVAAG